MRMEHPNFFNDEDYQEDIVFGDEGRFKPLNLDFWKDVYPNILKAHIDTHQPAKGYPDAFVPKDFYPIGIDQTLRLCIRPFVSIFSACFEMDTEDYKKGMIKNEDITNLMDAKGMVGALARIKTKVGVNGRYFLRSLLHLFKKVGNNPIKLTKYLPKPLYKDFLKEVRTPFYMLAELTKSPEIKEEIDKIMFLEHPEAIKSIKKPSKYRIVSDSYARSVVIFENIDFGRKEQEFFWDILCFHGAFNPMEGVLFKDCRFSANYVCPHKAIRARVNFEHCLFEKEFSPPENICHRMLFESCIVNGIFDFRKTLFHRTFLIRNCIFNENSKLLFDNSEIKVNDLGKRYHFSIMNTMFNGDISFRRASFLGCSLRLENLSFLKQFDFEETAFGRETIIRNIGFINDPTPERTREKEIFKNILLQHGYKSTVASLGLETKEDKRVPLRFYEGMSSGWMPPKIAADYVGKSISWLAKKRRADREMRTQTSIPFVGHRKTIFYPKSALYAFRVQDWNKLAECRKEYGFGEKERQDFKRTKPTYIADSLL